MSNFPNDAGVTRLVWAMLLEQNDEWSLNRRHMQLEGLQTLQGRPLAAVDGSYPVAQVGGQLSGGELARPTSAGRPISDIRCPKLVAPKQPVVSVPRPPRGPRNSRHTQVGGIQGH